MILSEFCSLLDCSIPDSETLIPSSVVIPFHELGNFLQPILYQSRHCFVDVDDPGCEVWTGENNNLSNLS